jgi:CheY-like chemotaxis protein
VKLLVVDDEDGIRDGLAAFLRHHGHLVATAASCAEAAAALAAGRPDVLITDWRLTDGTAHALIGAGQPAIVITGCPEEIDAGGATVLRKPVLPDALLVQLRKHGPAGGSPPCPDASLSDPLAGLPADTRDRVRLLLHGLGCAAAAIEDDGTFVTVTLPLGEAPAEDSLLARLGGDWTPPAAGGATPGRWRCYRDGRPPWVRTVVGPADRWPDDPAFAVDLDGVDLPLSEVQALAERIDAVHAGGREVHLLNLPGHLRLWLELLGRAQRLPMRTCTGPRLAAATRQLWS